MGPGGDGRALILGCPPRARVSRQHKYLFPSGSFRHLNCSYCFVQTETLVTGGPQKSCSWGRSCVCFGSVCVVTSAPRRPYMLHFALKMPEVFLKPRPLVFHRPTSDAAAAAHTCVFCFSRCFRLFDWIPGFRRGPGAGRGAASTFSPAQLRALSVRAWGLVCWCVHSKIESSSPWFLALGKLLFDFFKLQYLYDYYNNKVRFGFYSPVQGQPSFSALPLLKSFLGDLKS